MKRIERTHEKKITIALLIMISASACSNKAVYSDIQANQRHNCLTLPESEQARCLASLDMSYEDYERRRQLLREKQTND